MSRSSSLRNDDDFNQGFILPPIVAQLRKVLEQFPDDVQILKELIQNAEDAGAREVSFMLDLNTYGQDSRRLERPELTHFQGPALYCHNDSCFTEDDWKGLRMLSQSIKRDDPFRIGCFGIGFKSVFHLTDLPCILSGDRLAIVDPQQHVFEAGCHSVPVTPDLLLTLTHQVEPFVEIFDCARSTFQSGFYGGTIFRFPLRNRVSRLSSATCSADKVRELLESLETEAHLMLVFTSNITRVSVHEKPRGSKVPTLLFRAELAPSCVEEVQRMRSEFKENVRDHGKIRQVSSTFEVVILTEKHGAKSPVKKSYRYLVSHLNGATTVKSSQMFVNLLNDRDLNLLPWVATAMPLETEDCPLETVVNGDYPGHVTKEPYRYSPDDGRLFCFMPLPVERNVSSGLPFLIHGAFSLEQNKKLIKWPSISRFTDFTSDRLVQWNHCLLKEVLPLCYAQMISCAIAINVQDKFRVSVRSIYRAYPDLSRVERRWESIAPSFYLEVFRSPSFHCPNTDSWADIKGCLFLNGGSSSSSGGGSSGDFPPILEKAIRDVMTCGKIRLASCPSHVMQAAKKLSKPVMVTPAQVAEVLRTVQNNCSFPWEGKMSLLRYLLRHSSKVEILDGLELLPLANGGFTSFKVSSGRSTPQQQQQHPHPVYVASDEDTRLALPGLYDDTLEWEVDEDIRRALVSAAVRGTTQLKVIDSATACRLLPLCLPPDWLPRDGISPKYPIAWNPSAKDHPPEGWLKALWEFLARNFPRDLSCMDRIPIVPCRSYQTTTTTNPDEVKTSTITELVPLSPDQVIVARRSDDVCLDPGLESALAQLGIWVVDELPRWIRSHPHVFKGGPVLAPTGQNVLRALERRSVVVGGRSKFVANVFSALGPESRRAVRSALAKLSSFEVQKDGLELLVSLPVFEPAGLRGELRLSDFLPAANAIACLSPTEEDPKPPPFLFGGSVPMLDCSAGQECRALAKLLGVKQATISQLLVQTVLPDVARGLAYGREEVLQIGLYCLQNYRRLADADKSFARTMRSLAFLPRGDVLLPVERFYDPTDRSLRTLFLFEENFPPEAFCRQPGPLAALRELGLRGREEVEAVDVKECALVVQQLSVVREVLEILPDLSRKSDALLEYLEERGSKLTEKCDALALADLLRGVRFVRSCDRPPPERDGPGLRYPAGLEWYGGPGKDPASVERLFCSPARMALKRHARIVGSSMPLVSFDATAPDLTRAMGWDVPPPIERVAEHLARVVQSYDPNQQRLYSEIAVAVYHALANHPDRQEVIQLVASHLPLEWVWYGDGFVRPQEIVLDSSRAGGTSPRDFRPYVYPLPEELAPYGSFFEAFGAAERPQPLRVLEILRAKYDLGTSRGSGFRPTEVRSDLDLCVSLLEDVVFPDGRPDSDSKTESAEDEDFGLATASSSSVDGPERGGVVYVECSSPLFFSSGSFSFPRARSSCLSRELHLPAFEPDNSASSNRIRFERADLCVYHEGADLGVVGGYWEDKHKELQEKGLHLVHHLVPIDVCRALGVPSLAEVTMSKTTENVGFSPPGNASTSSFGFQQPQQQQQQQQQPQQQPSSTPFTEIIRPLVKPFVGDDFCVPVEMIQNADDAGATEIRFLLDERLNLDAVRSGLLDEGMGHWQGPALWVHNDAVMTDDDFAEAFTLDGTMKRARTDRIGRNGRGLCSVYTVTDVPSFVSRNWVVFFDPHFRYLGRSLKEKSKFGLRINLNRYRRQLNSLGGQFKPYEGVFGWSLRNPDVHYPATLFRLPLRVRRLAAASDICSKPCEVEDVKEMFRRMMKAADGLLLFSQNLVRVSAFHLGERGGEPVELFSVTKRPVRIVRELRPEVPREQSSQAWRSLDSETQKMVRQSNLLRSATEALKQIKNSSGSGGIFSLERFSSSSSSSSSTAVPDSSFIISIEFKASQGADRLLRLRREPGSSPWLVASCMERGEALGAALKHGDLVPCACAAVPLERLPLEGGYRPAPLSESRESAGGMVFNFLPMPIRTGLPVHVSGSFLVTDDHRDFARESRKGPAHPDWNERLMATAVAQAYLRLVCDLASLSPPDAYPYHILWPDVGQASAECLPLVKSFYREVSRSSKVLCAASPALFSDGSRWCPFESTYFFESGAYDDQKELADAAAQVSRQIVSGSQSGAVMVRLPSRVLRGFEQAGAGKAVTARTYSRVQFLEKVLLPQIESVPRDARDLIVTEAIVRSRLDPALAAVLRSWQCVPVGQGAGRFEKPSRLVDPRSPLHALYGRSEACTPQRPYAKDDEVLDALCLLGMKFKAGDVSWEEVVARCRAIQSCKDQALVRDSVQAALFVIGEKLALESEKSFSGLRHFQQVLADLPFLLAKPRPADFVLPLWSGVSDATPGRGAQPKVQLYRASSLFSPECYGLVCCVQPILDESTLPRDPSNVFGFLKIGLEWKEPTVGQVADQLDVLTNPEHESRLADKKFRSEIEKLCLSCYAFLQMKCSSSESQRRAVSDALKGRYFVLCENRFLLPNQFAFSFPYDAAPYLYRLPDCYQREFPDLFRAMEARDQFGVKDYVEALQCLHDARPREKLDRNSYSLAATLIGLLKEALRQSGMRTCDVIDRFGPIYLPDSANVLRSTSELRIDDIVSQPVGGRSSVSQQPQVALKSPPPVQRVQTEPTVQRYSSGGYQQQQQQQQPFSSSSSFRTSESAPRSSRPFGARGRETLIARLRRIVCGGRSTDRDILKELLRLADDAGASEVSFVKDPRTHRTAEEFWQRQQGPSLCVHFDRHLTDAQLENVVAFGHCRRSRTPGKSAGDPAKSGLYGVGFDSVYRLTDVPSVLTGSGDAESLWVFDPQARFLAGTSVDEPVRRFDGLGALRRASPDVLDAYLEEKFAVRDGTTVRLPLRTHEMAARSELSDEPADAATLDSLFDKLRQEIFDCLLFLESVSSVSMLEVDPETDVLRELYKISVDNTEFSAEGKSEFYASVERAQAQGQGQGQGQKLIDLPNHEVTYPLTMSDNHGHWEKWVVSHRFGLDAGAKVPPGVSEAVRTGRLVLPPYGGVAAMLDSSDAESHNRPSKAFARLPLNARTELPVHLNANFCTDDDESGRNLWPEEESGYKAEWNNLLLRSVVAHAYVAVLSQTVPMMGSVRSGAGACVYLGALESFGDEVPELETYARFFPKLTRQTPSCYWRHLAESVYQIVDAKQVAVIPVARVGDADHHHPGSVSSSMTVSIATGTTEVEWYPTRVVGYQKPHFDNLRESYREIEDQLRASAQSQSASTPTTPSFMASSSSQARKRRSRSHLKRQPYELLRWCLLASGFKLSRLPLSVYESFLAAGVAVACVTPKAVIDFFRSHQKALASPAVALPQLPCDLSETPFRDESTLKILLEYCSRDIPHFRSNLSGLPLLLCEDGLLRPFSSARDRRVFLSNASHLLPGSESLFVHRSLVGSIFKEADVESCDVFWRFDVRSLAARLPGALDRAYAVESAMRRDVAVGGAGCPEDAWLREVWSFLADEFQRTTSESGLGARRRSTQQVQDDRALALDFLQPLVNWCLLPVVLRVRVPDGSPSVESGSVSFADSGRPEEETTCYLVPFTLAHAVLDYSGNSISGNQIRRCFGRMGIFELDVSFFEEATPSGQSLSPAVAGKRLHQSQSKSLSTGSSSSSSSSSSLKILSLLRLVVSSPESPKSVLAAVEHVLSRPEGPGNVGLNPDESHTILKYFSDARHSAWRLDEDARKRLLAMPVHSSADERSVPVDVDRAYVLKSDVPYSGMMEWQKRAGAIFIKPCPAFEALYSALGCGSLTPAEAYAEHLLPGFELLPVGAREEHLLFVRDSLVPSLKSGPERDSFLGALSEAKILPDGRDAAPLRRPVDLHDPRVSVYQAMARTDGSIAFPAAPYDSADWLDFLTRCARLESEPTGDAMVAFARRLAGDSKRLNASVSSSSSPDADESYETLVAQCRSLMGHLFDPKVVTDPHCCLEKLRDVAFLPPARPQPGHLRLLHGRESTPSKINPNVWVTFKECASHRHHDVCWSSVHLLPAWADPFEVVKSSSSSSGGGVETKTEDAELFADECSEAYRIAERLGYDPLPSVDAVVEHVQNICSSSSSATPAAAIKSPSLASFPEESSEVKCTKASALHGVYKFLSERLEEAEDHQALAEVQRSLHKLSSVACVALDGGTKFVSPKQVVINLYDDDQVAPYVCRAPAELGQFKRLLIDMGATSTATPEQYAGALDGISRQAGGEKLHPNELRLAFTAVRGLFESLRRVRHRDGDPLARVQRLYLPAVDGHMRRSTEMLFNDDGVGVESPDTVERLRRGGVGRALLVDLAECRLGQAEDHAGLVALLPQRLRPVYLSATVREHLEPGCREAVVYHAVADKLRYQMSSRQFAQGIVRLARHERSRRRGRHRTPVRQSALDRIERTLKKVRVHGLDRLVTYLTLEGRRVEGSEAELECFAERSADDDEEEGGEGTGSTDVWNVYLNRAACLTEELQTSLAEAVNRMTGGLLRDSVHYVQPVLSCLPHNIAKVLDKLNVRPDVPQSPDPSCQPTLPAPGTLIPKEDHHLLKEDFEEFDVGEYVGCELEDDETDGCPTVIYAVILERIVHEDFDSSRPGSTTPSVAVPPSSSSSAFSPSGGLRGFGRGRSPQQGSPQRKQGVSCSSEPDSRKFAQKYWIDVGEERPPTIASVTDLYKFHRVEGRRRWNDNSSSRRQREEEEEEEFEEPGVSPPNQSRQQRGKRQQKQQKRSPTGDGAFEADESFSRRCVRNEDETNQRPQSSSTSTASASASASRLQAEDRSSRLASRRKDSRSPRSVFTESNLFAHDEGPDSPSGDSHHHHHHHHHHDPWRKRSTPRDDDVELPPTSTDVCQYDEEWGQRRRGATATGDDDDNRQRQKQREQPPKRGEFEPRDESDVITTERVMEEVSDALEEAWQLPENQRRKVVKRLLLRWHPDKNIGNEAFATIITQHVQAELERLELGLPRPASFDPSQFDFDPRNPFSGSSSFQQNFAQAYKYFFDQMNQRAKEHKQQRERYRNEGRGGDFDGSDQFGSAYGANPQPAQARRFLRQAQEDLRASDNDYDALDPSYEWVCFKAHQAAEKALKAAQYAVDAVTSFSHDLVTLAASLEDTELRRLAQKLQKIVGNSNRLYNPDPVDFQVIPHEDFTKEMACDAVMCAVDVLERVKEFVELRGAN